MVSEKHAKIYKQIVKAQAQPVEETVEKTLDDSAYERKYEEVQNVVMKKLTRLFNNPVDVWQEGLKYYFDVKKKGDANPEDLRDKLNAARSVEGDIDDYSKPNGKTREYLDRVGQKKSRGEKSTHTKNSYTWSTDRSGKHFDSNEVIESYDIQNGQDALAWCEKYHRTVDSLAILLAALGQGGEQGKYTEDSGWRNEESVAKYIEWLSKAGKWNPETDHFTQMKQTVVPKLLDFKKQMTGAA